MSEKDISSNWIDPDDAPALTSEWFETASAYQGDKPLRRGRPRLAEPKQLVSLRLDREVVDRLREQGPGWQTRINKELRKVVGLG
jgi:uncharacterized protein (DUF4415 family)